MSVVDGHNHRRGIGFSEQDDMLVRMKIKHDYPACALFRGGKCTCDEADKLCPKCGSEEWDRITDRASPGAAFNRCNRCENEWEPEMSGLVEHAGLLARVQLTTDQRYWLDRRAQIIEALAAEGLEIWSDKDRVWLRRIPANLPQNPASTEGG
jgi:hypothetical protein